MNQIAIFWPMIAHVALVYAVYGLLSVRRRWAVKAGSVRVSQFRENREEPPESLFVHNNLLNQFQLPVLFHICCLALYVTAGAGLVAVILAWLFVVSRYLHAWIHVTSNRIRFRSPVFAFGYVVVGAMWFWFAFHLLTL